MRRKPPRLRNCNPNPQIQLLSFSPYQKGTNMDVVYVQDRRGRSCMAMLFDVFMLLITGGFWVIWMIIRKR
jgi:hypothetical protein